MHGDFEEAPETVSAQPQFERGSDDGLGPVRCVLEVAQIKNFSAFYV
jgi:hypothetical protein